jgi:hypothetical protein
MLYLIKNVLSLNVSFFFFWHKSPMWTRATSFLRLLDHTHNNTPQAVGLFQTSDWQETDMHTPVGLKPAISANKWPHTLALDRLATGISYVKLHRKCSTERQRRRETIWCGGTDYEIHS